MRAPQLPIITIKITEYSIIINADGVLHRLFSIYYYFHLTRANLPTLGRKSRNFYYIYLVSLHLGILLIYASRRQ